MSAVPFIFIEFVCFCAQPQQNPATGSRQEQDANPVNATAQVPQDANLPLLCPSMAATTK